MAKPAEAPADGSVLPTGNVSVASAMGFPDGWTLADEMKAAGAPQSPGTELLDRDPVDSGGGDDEGADAGAGDEGGDEGDEAGAGDEGGEAGAGDEGGEEQPEPKPAKPAAPSKKKGAEAAKPKPGAATPKPAVPKPGEPKPKPSAAAPKPGEPKPKPAAPKPGATTAPKPGENVEPKVKIGDKEYSQKELADIIAKQNQPPAAPKPAEPVPPKQKTKEEIDAENAETEEKEEKWISDNMKHVKAPLSEDELETILTGGKDALETMQRIRQRDITTAVLLGNKRAYAEVERLRSGLMQQLQPIIEAHIRGEEERMANEFYGRHPQFGEHKNAVNAIVNAVAQHNPKMIKDMSKEQFFDFIAGETNKFLKDLNVQVAAPAAAAPEAEGGEGVGEGGEGGGEGEPKPAAAAPAAAAKPKPRVRPPSGNAPSGGGASAKGVSAFSAIIKDLEGA